MKKILLMSLVLIGCDVKEAPAYANSADLKCDAAGDLFRYVHLTLADSDREGYAYSYLVRFDEEGKAKYLRKDKYKAKWSIDFVSLKSRGETFSKIDRESLSFILNPGEILTAGARFYDCEITDDIQAKAQQWEQEHQEHLNTKNKI